MTKKNDKITPFISILMPTYNVALYVVEAVNSILQQSYDNFELIIVDDCSTDGTFELLQDLAKKDSRIVLLRNDKNSKICFTLNKAFKIAKGRYICRMDGDDISNPDRLKVLVEYLRNNPNIDLVGSQLVSIDERGTILSYKKYLRKPKFINIANHIFSSVPHFWLAKYEVYETLS